MAGVLKRWDPDTSSWVPIGGSSYRVPDSEVPPPSPEQNNLWIDPNDHGPVLGSLVPVGGVIMYDGLVADIPTNWALCDGTNGTPDLRDRFIVGSGGEYGVGDTGGADEVALTTDEMPAHGHTSGTLTTANDTHDHNSTFRSYLSGADGVAFWQRVEPGASQGTTKNDRDTFNSTHNHSVSGTTATNGGGSAHENRPPYYALAFIKRIA